MSAAVGAVLQGLRYLPASLGVKALTKVNPKFKNFFADAAAYGVDVNRAVNYLSERFGNPQNQQFQQHLESKASRNQLRPDEAVIRSQMQNESLPRKALQGAASFATGGLLGAGGGEEESMQSMERENATQKGFDPLAGLQQYPELIQFIQSEASKGENATSIASKARKRWKLADMVRKIEKEASEPFENLLSRLIGGGQKQAGSISQGNAPNDDALIAAMDKLLRM